MSKSRALLFVLALLPLLPNAHAEGQHFLCFTKPSTGGLNESLWSLYLGAKEILLPDKSLAFKVAEDTKDKLVAHRDGKFRSFDHDKTIFELKKATNATSLTFTRKPSRFELGQCLATRGWGCDDHIVIVPANETGYCKLVEPSWHIFMRATEGKQIHFFDSETVVSSGTSRFVWVRSVEAYQPGSGESWSTERRFHLSCSRRTFKIMASAYFDKNGKFMSAPTAIPEELTAPPGSLAAEFLAAACTKSFPSGNLLDGYMKVRDNDTSAFTRSLVQFRDGDPGRSNMK